MESCEIVRTLLKKLPGASESVYAINMGDILTAIAERLGEEALLLTPEDLLLAQDEVREVFGHYLDEREIMALALDQWEIVRNL